MIVYRLDFSNTAKKDLKFFKKSGNLVILKKIKQLLVEVSKHPYEGTGKPEQLKFDFSGYWSRRINLEHRMIYEVYEEDRIVAIYSLKGHYF